MAYQFVQLTGTSKYPSFFKLAAWGTAIGFMMGFTGGDGGAYGFCGLVIACLVWVVWYLVHATKVWKAALADFARRGYHADFEMDNVLIDSKAKVIAFIDRKKCSYDLYSMHDILAWEHQWVDSTSTSSNVWGDRAIASTRQIRSKIVFKTNNPSKPIYKVAVLSHEIGEEWMARLGAIING